MGFILYSMKIRTKLKISRSATKRRLNITKKSVKNAMSKTFYQAVKLRYYK